MKSCIFFILVACISLSPINSFASFGINSLESKIGHVNQMLEDAKESRDPTILSNAIRIINSNDIPLNSLNGMPSSEEINGKMTEYCESEVKNLYEELPTATSNRILSDINSLEEVMLICGKSYKNSGIDIDAIREMQRNAYMNNIISSVNSYILEGNDIYFFRALEWMKLAGVVEYYFTTGEYGILVNSNEVLFKRIKSVNADK